MKRLIYFLMIVAVLLPNIALAQKKPSPEQWIEGCVTAFAKDSISVDGIKYQLDPLVVITDFKGNTLNIRHLRGAEAVKALVVDEKVRKIIITIFRE